MRITTSALSFLIALLVVGIPTGAQESITDVVQKVKPAVVTVITYDEDGAQQGFGTGFFVSKSHVITCFHVIDGAARAEVKSATGKVYQVKGTAGSDQIADIVRLALEQPLKDATVLTLAKTVPKEGERIVVVGSPLGLEQTVTDGIVSAVRDIPGMGKFIQLTAAISPGSSGSPVVDLKGEVVGVATSYLVEGQSLNFAVSSEHIRSLKLGPAVGLGQPKAGTDSVELGQLTQAFTYVLNEEYEKALPLLRAATEQDPSNWPAWSVLGVAYGKLGRWTEAIAAFKQAIRIKPDYVKAHYNLGVAYGELGRHAEEIAAYKEAIRIKPDDAEAHSNLGVAYGELGRHAEAIEAYKEAIRSEPDYAEAHCNLGVAYGELGRWTEAIAAFKQAIRIKPDFANAHYNLGLAYLFTDDRAGALDEYRILKGLDTERAKQLFDLIYE